MKIYKIFGFISCFILSSCALHIEDEESAKGDDGDSTTQLSWSGETDKFTITSKEGIRLDDPQEAAGTAYLAFPSSSVRNTRWEFGVKLTFNPSANNYARFYLTSSTETLSNVLNGYYIQIGGAKDNVALYRQNEDKSILLASGRELMKGNNSPKLYIKVECDNNGYWTFWTRLESENEYTKEKQIKDTSIQNSEYCGIYCVYTKSRCDGFTFHHIQISNEVETTTDPDGSEEVPDNPETPDEPDNPEDTGIPSYPEEVRNLLVFNEVMYDNATDGAEYIELYNPSDNIVSIPPFKLLRYVADESGATQTTTTAVLEPSDGSQVINIPPHGYICFTKSASTLIKKHKVSGETMIETAKFPRINNAGGHLAIVTNEEQSRLIDKCSYSDQTHTDRKRKQGVSLEKKSPELASAFSKNWTSSKNATGGTPGIKNSQE
ncbi:lamin tail domain-containing protein [Bacteroides sp.]|uniref:lamin tail domain-containing protein n=1 Tax=Bacteroides sp. TaxID=29523 RepID=UPI002606AE78|nr:lamin tail domain-containing protein [Bacteroides sp.]MDD3038450.1 lamin tail domain-containing protein [Bacteroides sp.]